MDELDYYEITVGGKKHRGLTIRGLGKVREALGMAPIPHIMPGEDVKAYKERIRSLRAEALVAFRTAPAELGERLFGPGAKDLAGGFPLKDIFFFPEGQVAATDEAGVQVPEEQTPAFSRGRQGEDVPRRRG